MKKLFMSGVAVVLLQLGGCAGMVIEARGLTPGATLAIMSRLTALAEARCKNGVAFQSREAETRNVYYGGNPYRELPISRPETVARSITVCR